MSRTQIQFPGSLYRRLKEIAEQQDWSLSEVMRKATEHFVTRFQEDPKPKSARETTAFCDTLRTNPVWEFGDYESDVATPLWNWAAKSKTGFRHIIDARLALTLRHHGVTHFATANEKGFEGLEFDRLWSPL